MKSKKEVAEKKISLANLQNQKEAKCQGPDMIMSCQKMLVSRQRVTTNLSFLMCRLPRNPTEVARTAGKREPLKCKYLLDPRVMIGMSVIEMLMNSSIHYPRNLRILSKIFLLSTVEEERLLSSWKTRMSLS